MQLHLRICWSLFAESTYRVSTQLSIASPRAEFSLVCCRKKSARMRKIFVMHDQRRSSMFRLKHWNPSEPSWVLKWRFPSISSLAYFEVDRDSQTSPKSSFELAEKKKQQKLVRLEKRKSFFYENTHVRSRGFIIARLHDQEQQSSQ